MTEWNESAAAPQAGHVSAAERPEVREVGFAFHGSAGEYFRIWIVNVLLSIVTLGIYSAWAKVRTRRGSPVHNQVGYAAAKGRVDNLTRQMAVELAPHGITVNAIAPGFFSTALTVDPAVPHRPRLLLRDRHDRPRRRRLDSLVGTSMLGASRAGTELAMNRRVSFGVLGGMLAWLLATAGLGCGNQAPDGNGSKGPGRESLARDAGEAHGRDASVMSDRDGSDGGASAGGDRARDTSTPAGPAASADGGAGLSATDASAGITDAGVALDAGVATNKDDAGMMVGSPACEPIAEVLTPQARVLIGENCANATSEETRLPNLYWAAASIEDVPLTVPLTPGQPYALSLQPWGNVDPGSIEIWGSNAACGPVDELLWFGDMDGRRQCVELTPTRAHARLQFVSRMLAPLSFHFRYGPGTLQMCPAGTCPAGSDGNPLRPGVALDPPVGVYPMTCKSLTTVPNCEVGYWGHVVLFPDPARESERTREYVPAKAGWFRAPPSDPYGDAWYCAGMGSDIEESKPRERIDLRLRDLTRVRACQGGPHSATFDGSGGASRRFISSTLAELTDEDYAVRKYCWLNRCRFRFTGRATSLYLYLTVDTPLEDVTEPGVLDIVEADWFVGPSDGFPVRRTCTTSGTLAYEPSTRSITTVQLDGLSALETCPGEPVRRASVDLVGEL